MIKIKTSTHNEISSLFEAQGGAGSWVLPTHPLFSIRLALEGWELFLILCNFGGFSQLDSHVHRTLKPHAGHWAAHLTWSQRSWGGLACKLLCQHVHVFGAIGPQPIPIQLCLVIQLPTAAERKMILDSCHQMCWDIPGSIYEIPLCPIPGGDCSWLLHGVFSW